MECQSIPLEFPLEDDSECKSKAIEAVKILRPKWNENNLKIGFYTNGITNKIFHCQPVGAEKTERLIFRVYGQGTEQIIDRAVELKNWRVLEKNGCAAPLLSTFKNGLIVGYQPGETLEKTDVRDPIILREIARSMVKLHSIKVEESKVCLYDKINGFISSFPSSFPENDRQKLFETHYPKVEKLKAELALIRKTMTDLQSPPVFCHNDLLLHNVLFDTDTQSVNFIDYEYAGCNYQAFDIGNHFCEFAGLEDVDFSLFPDREFQLKWLRTYLEFFNQQKGISEPTENDIERLYVQVNKGATVAHFFWATWAIVQAAHSTLDFDYFQYGLDRIEQYWIFKEKYFCLEVPQ